MEYILKSKKMNESFQTIKSTEEINTLFILKSKTFAKFINIKEILLIMSVKIEDLSVTLGPEYQRIESYLFIKQGYRVSERVLLSTPRLDQNRDSLGGMRPISILYSQISNDKSQWVHRVTHYQATDRKDAFVSLIYSPLENYQKSYMDTKATLEILREGLNSFKADYSLSGISLENVISAFERAV